MPLPPYIERPASPEDRERYQTVYAKQPGAVAAPTAGLHFTPAILEALDRHGIGLAGITLHVGPGTFRPVKTEDPETHIMDSELFDVPAATAEAVAETRRRGGKVVAVGTTVVRTLETVASGGGLIEARGGRTELFIRPGYEFQVTDRLITNFHLPRSTLLMVVCAFAGRNRTLDAYRQAIASGFRFYILRRRDAGLSQPEDAVSQGRRAEPVVDVDHRNPRRARREHGEQRRDPLEAGAVADAGRHRDHRTGHQTGNHRRQGAVHAGHDHGHIRAAKFVHRAEQTLEAGDTDIPDALDLVTQPAGAHRRLLGHREIRRSRADNRDPPTRGRPEPAHRPDPRPRLVATVRDRRAQPFGRRRRDPRDQRPARMLHHRLDDPDQLAVALALAEDDLGQPTPEFPEQVELGRTQVEVRQASHPLVGVLRRDLAGGHAAEQFEKFLPLHYASRQRQAASAPPVR